MGWNNLKSFVKYSIRKIVIDILIVSGYNDSISLLGMNEQEIKIIETFIFDHLHTLSEQYSHIKLLVFLLGHKKLLMSLGKNAEQHKPSTNP